METRSNVTRWGRGAEEAGVPPACLKNSSHAGGGVALSCTSHRLPFVVSGPVVRLMTSVRVSPVALVLLLTGWTAAVVSCSLFPFIGGSFVQRLIGPVRSAYWALVALGRLRAAAGPRSNTPPARYRLDSRRRDRAGQEKGWVHAGEERNRRAPRAGQDDLD